MIDSFLNRSVTTISIYLRPTGNPRTNLMFNHIPRHFLFELFYKIWPFRPWPNYGHITFQYIKKLWQFVNTGFTHKSAPLCFTWVILGSPLFSLFIISLHMHRAEFVHHKRLSIEPYTFLMKNNRSGRGQFNHHNRKQHNW